MAKKICITKKLCFDMKTFVIFLIFGCGLIIWSRYYAISDYTKKFKRWQRNININIINPSKNEHIFDRRINDKREAPYRSNSDFYFPINIRTRGELPNFQQIGFLHDSTNSSMDSQRLPLMSRPKYYGSTEYEHYVVDGSRNAIKVPLTNNKEITDGESITVPGVSGDYNSVVYEIDEPRYIPDLVH